MTPKQLTRLRSKAGVSKQQLADLIGVHRTTVFRWEAGTIPLPKPAAAAIRWYLSRREAQARA